MLKILVVDDDELILKTVHRALRTEYEVLTAISAYEGLRILEEDKEIRAVISDYMMPDMDGLDFLRIVLDKYPDTLRIVLSGQASKEVILKAIHDCKIYKFIGKPWENEDLEITLSKGIDSNSYIWEKHLLIDKLTKNNVILDTINSIMREVKTTPISLA